MHFRVSGWEGKQIKVVEGRAGNPRLRTGVRRRSRYGGELLAPRRRVAGGAAVPGPGGAHGRLHEDWAHVGRRLTGKVRWA